MAAKTPDSYQRTNLGGANMVTAVFSSTTVSDTDTWTSGMTGIRSWRFCQTNNPTTQASAGVSVAQAAGVFTFYPGEDATCTGYLEIMIAG